MINIDRECEHKIIIKQGLVLIATMHEMIEDLEKINEGFKVFATNVSLINDNSGAQISKIGGTGYSNEEAYMDFIKVFNNNRTFHTEENKILLCCNEIPEITLDDLKDFRLTRRIQFSWKIGEEIFYFFAYIREEKDKLVFTYDGTEESHYANSDKEIIEFILKNCDFTKQPKFTSIRRSGRLFYPTIENFNR